MEKIIVISVYFWKIFNQTNNAIINKQTNKLKNGFDLINKKYLTVFLAEKENNTIKLWKPDLSTNKNKTMKKYQIEKK